MKKTEHHRSDRWGFRCNRRVQTIREHGGAVIARNFATSEYFSMPRSAIATGAVEHLLPLHEIGPMIVRLAGRAAKRRHQ